MNPCESVSQGRASHLKASLRCVLGVPPRRLCDLGGSKALACLSHQPSIIDVRYGRRQVGSRQRRRNWLRLVQSYRLGRRRPTSGRRLSGQSGDRNTREIGFVWRSRAARGGSRCRELSSDGGRTRRTGGIGFVRRRRRAAREWQGRRGVPWRIGNPPRR